MQWKVCNYEWVAGHGWDLMQWGSRSMGATSCPTPPSTTLSYRSKPPSTTLYQEQFQQYCQRFRANWCSSLWSNISKVTSVWGVLQIVFVFALMVRSGLWFPAFICRFLVVEYQWRKATTLLSHRQQSDQLVPKCCSLSWSKTTRQNVVCSLNIPNKLHYGKILWILWMSMEWPRRLAQRPTNSSITKIDHLRNMSKLQM